uniref:Uncharacterized protein n=1 Tax=Arion vulgaris TaxID=1028688 RepID=A0A0B6Z0N6_9EUPU
MDPIAKEEWYRLGRSREWRHRKKLLDPEGFKRYNNERAKRYQENLRKNNPEKYKEMRAKGADRLRQYRFSQRIMKAMKEGKEIKISDSVPIAKKLTQVCGRRNETVIEVQEGDEELLIQDNIDKAHYVIPECATTHGEAATGRESSSARTDHPAQPDILDLMYNY